MTTRLAYPVMESKQHLRSGTNDLPKPISATYVAPQAVGQLEYLVERTALFRHRTGNLIDWQEAHQPSTLFRFFAWSGRDVLVGQNFLYVQSLLASHFHS